MPNKLRVFVVEDEELFLDDIIQKVHRTGLPCKVIGFSYDAEAALKQILAEKPDVVLTDIRLPGMDGLALVQCIRDMLPDTICVLISGFMDFDYARQGIRLGVQEYLMKPVQPEKLFDTLSHILALLANRILAQQKLYLLSQITLSEQTEAQPDIFPTGKLHMFFLCIGNRLRYGTKVYQDTLYASLFQSFSWADFVRDALGEPFWVVSAGASNERYLFLTVRELSPAAQAKKLLHQFADVYPSQHMNITYCDSEVAAQDVGHKATLLYEYMTSHLKAWKSDVFPWQPGSQPDTQQVGYAKPFLEHMTMSAKGDNAATAISRAIASSMQGAYMVNPTQAYMETYVLSAISALHSKYPKKSQRLLLDSRLQLVGLISVTSSYGQFVKELESALLEIYHSKQPDIVSKRMDIAETVKQQLDEGYRHSISINAMAAEYYVSSKHLIRLFKQRYGKSPLQYLISRRLTEAQRLLVQTDTSISAIANAVSYDDVNYFNRLFKNNFGETPSEYRMKRYGKVERTHTHVETEQ